MNVARINAAHGSLEQHRSFIRIIKDLNESGTLSRLNPAVPCVGILLDTKGAEIRTGDVVTPITVTAGQEVVFSPKPLPKEKRVVITVDYDHFHRDVQHARKILLDNGKIGFDLVSIERDGSVIARARDDGSIGSRRHINLPGAYVDLPPITEEDWKEIAMAADEDVDFLGLSFIQHARDVEEVRTFVQKRNSAMKLIAKIETETAIQNLAEILHASDGLMVARGDLGAEVPYESLPVYQDEMVALAREAGKPVIVATHMLESMNTNPMPTRAEVTDIAHAATTGTDVTMLSGETASGKYPFASVEAMDRVLRATETHLQRMKAPSVHEARNEREARAEAAVRLAKSANAKAIMVMTKSGQSARDVAKFRPHTLVIAFTEDASVQRKLQLSYGVIPLRCPLHADPEKTVKEAMRLSKEANLLSPGSTVVLMSDAKAHELTVNSIEVRTVL
jgi:pyruvate kinase